MMDMMHEMHEWITTSYACHRICIETAQRGMNSTGLWRARTVLRLVHTHGQQVACALTMTSQRRLDRLPLGVAHLSQALGRRRSPKTPTSFWYRYSGWIIFQ
ncbi:putative tubulin--tyrosine ligase C12B10.04 [Fusarium oxysporum f. sp. albedinis]|nr:putative tubulin--tyrosine ligase C12B10.04 [Fusarium oxysporum f. sp. albedinis]